MAAAQPRRRLSEMMQLTNFIPPLNSRVQLLTSTCSHDWSKDRPISLVSENALCLTGMMNGCWCRQLGCPRCSQPIDEWLGAILDWYITIKAKDGTIYGVSHRHDLEQVEVMMGVISRISTQHIMAMHSIRQANPSGAAERALVDAVGHVLLNIVQTDPTNPPFSNAALICASKFMFEKGVTRYDIPPDLLCDFFNWATESIGREPINAGWLSEFDGERFHCTLKQAVSLIGNIFYFVPVADAAAFHYEIVVRSVCHFIVR